MASVRPRQAREREKGAALVEFALCLPLLLVVIAGIVDFAFLFQRYEVVTNAAREGARLGATPAYSGEFGVIRTHVRNYVKTSLGMTDAALATVMPTSPEAVEVVHVVKSYTVGGTPYSIPAIQVRVTYEHPFLLLGPMLSLIGGSFGDTFDIVATSEMRLEAPGS